MTTVDRAGSLDGLRAVLRPIEAVDPSRRIPDPAALRERWVAYVVAGEGSEVLRDLVQHPDPLILRLFDYPGQMRRWSYSAPDVRDRLATVGLNPVRVAKARHAYYASHEPTLAELARLGRLWAAMGPPNRVADGVPLWFTALLNDVTKTFPTRRPSDAAIAAARGRWTPDFLAAILSTAGPARPAVVFLALFQQEPHLPSRFLPNQLPQVDDYLIAHAADIPASCVRVLTSHGRIALCERAAANPTLGRAFASFVALSSVDPSKPVRVAAIRVLEALPASSWSVELRSTLAKVPESRAGELVEFLWRSREGQSVLGEAATDGAKIAALYEQARRRAKALHARRSEA